MKAVTAASGYDVDLCSSVTTKLNAVGVGLNLKFAYRLGNDGSGRKRHANVIVIRAINRKVVVSRTLAICRNSSLTTSVGNIGRKQRQVIDVASRAKRKFDSLPRSGG